MSGRSCSLCVCVLVLLALVWPAFALGSTASSTPQQGREDAGDISWTLGLRLYRALRADGIQNPLFSPLLLATSLAAVGGRAGGSTARQFQEALNSSALPLSDQWEALSRALKSARAANGTSFNLHSSSVVFTKQAPSLNQQFLEEAQTRSLLEHVPLGPGDSQADLDTLLTWAKRGMGGDKGAELTGEIKAESGGLILAHALHFRGVWDRGFDEDHQDLRTFLGTKYTKVPMIYRAGVYRHWEDMVNMVQVIELQLWGGKASLVLLLPFHVEPLSRLERLLTPTLLGVWLKELSNMSMAISLPRTTLSSTLNLQKHLSALGLTDAWDEGKADFSGVTGQPGGGEGKLHLGGVLHWASLELSPEGGPDEAEDEEVGRPKMFYADHSFIVLVKDNATGALLLMGALDQAEGPALHDEL
ncbi:serine (or cysteine) peptidase inhibitor, clade H, member 2 [Conger conger]|uniref:serine (or cysteine) peptidase inhibitor, clade H, member 2 n=1 Tax=Conger conger TaxID=82655 RepID=UPI002A59FE0E|nr:serine (or cysteine) peptidase inhibitor, clade H, member 2 [Conger conger]